MNALKRLPWSYLLLAYGWAWLLWIPVAAARRDYQASPLLMAIVMLGVFGPGLAGLLLTYRDHDPAAPRDFWRRLFDLRRIRGAWVLLMLLVWPALHEAANLLSQAIGRPAPASTLLAQISAQPMLSVVVVAMYFLQAMLEDMGWRGYMGERLLRVFSPGKTALLVGVFHAFWHLPLFFVVGTNQIRMGLGLDFWVFVAQAVAFSVYATWCYVDNARSTLAAILLHTVGNLCNDIFTLPGGAAKFYIFTLLMILGAVVLHLRMSPRAAASPAASPMKEALP